MECKHVETQKLAHDGNEWCFSCGSLKMSGSTDWIPPKAPPAAEPAVAGPVATSATMARDATLASLRDCARRIEADSSRGAILLETLEDGRIAVTVGGEISADTVVVLLNLVDRARSMVMTPL